MPRIINNKPDIEPSLRSYKQVYYTCRVCRKIHPLRKCKAFLSMDAKGRQRAVKMFKYCRNCLAHHHSQKLCRSIGGCHICHHQHHTLLHETMTRQTERLPRKIGFANKHRQQSSTNSKNLNLPQQMVTILPTAIGKIAYNGRFHPIRILVDTGSTISRITQSAINVLSIPTNQVGNSLMCLLDIRSPSDSRVRIKAVVNVDKRITLKTPQRSIVRSLKERFTNLILADPTFYESGSVSMVLGADLYSKIILAGIIPNFDGDLMAQNSALGWLISGNCPM